MHIVDGEFCVSAHIPSCSAIDAYFIHRQNETIHDTWFRVRATHPPGSTLSDTIINDPVVCSAHALQLGAAAYRYTLPSRRCTTHSDWALDETPHAGFSLNYDFTRALTADQRANVVSRALRANDCLLDTFDCYSPDAT